MASLDVYRRGRDRTAESIDDPDLLRCVDRILRAAESRDEIGIRVMRLSCGAVEPARIVREASRALTSLGFVAMSASAQVGEGLRRELAHRHVVLFTVAQAWDVAEEYRLIAWIRTLAAVSTRAHLIVRLEIREPRVRSAGNPFRGASLAREAVARPSARPLTLAASWSDDVRERALAAAASHIQHGRLSEAESAIRALAAEAAVRGWPRPTEADLVMAEIRFWQGRFDEARDAVPETHAAGSDADMWRALIAWAGDLRATLPPSALRGARPWLRAAMVAQARIELGDEDTARQLIAARRAVDPAPPLEAALLRQIEHVERNRPGGPADVEIARFVCRSGARGLWRWGQRRTVMNFIHSVSSLLEVVQEAADEGLALRHGCSWVREQASADAAGIVASDGARVIAGEGVRTADLADPDWRAAVADGGGHLVADGRRATASAPVRYGGSTIGVAVVRGRSESAESLESAARALASACAPALRARLDGLALAAASQHLVPEILGRSPAIRSLRAAVARAAPAPFAVLIEGESGTGKELVARAVHRLSPRRDRRLAALNCAALTDELLEAELFGHTRGAFTGAVAARAGLFEESHGSTLFLDEVAELSPRAQAKLLRVLQEREIRRVGEHLSRPVDVRVVAATNLPLTGAVAAGRFREDLLFRLAVVRLRVPPLRDRLEDVPLLAHAFWKTSITAAGKQAWLGPDAVASLCRHTWPGNVRELQNVIAALAVAAPAHGRIGARHVAQAVIGRDAAEMPSTLGEARAAFDRRMIAAALARHGGHCARAARELGLSRQGLVKAMKRLGLDDDAKRRRIGVNDVQRRCVAE